MLVMPILETALGLWNVGEVAAESRVEQVAFGSLDFQFDLGMGMVVLKSFSMLGRILWQPRGQ